MVKNYFTIRGPVPPDLFFDRREIVEFFRRQLDHENYGILIALVAPFKFGKTSILLKLYDIARNYERVIPILLRLNVIPDPLHTLLRQLSKYLDIDIDSLLNAVNMGRISLYDVFSSINDALERMDRWVILFIDEFQRLAKLVKGEGFLTNYPDDYIFEFIRGVTETFRFGLVVSGSIVGELLDAIDVWHGRFFIFRPRSFPREDSITMLQTLFRLSGFEVSRDIAEYIAIASNDHPYHMQLFGYYLVDKHRIDEQVLEEVRKKVEKFLVDYYEAKLLEAKALHPKAMEILKKTISGLELLELDNDELEAAIELERRGFIFKLNGKLEIFDPMFKRYIMNIFSGRPREKYLPEYTSEYLVAKKLAYSEGFRNVFISLMSWGPFDILIQQKIASYNGIGIQVKRTYKIETIKETLKQRLIKEARKINVIPIIALVKMPEKKIIYISSEKNITADNLLELLRELTGTELSNKQ